MNKRLRQYARIIIRTKAFKLFLLALICFSLLLILLDKVIMPWYVHHGQELILPDVTGKRFEEAKMILESQGFKIVKDKESYDSFLPQGYVLSQNPKAHAIVKKGRRVYVTVSIGERFVVVPRLIGGSERDAQFTLKRLGLDLGEVNYEFSSYYPKGVVSNQSVPSDSSVRRGTVVDITVSMGTPPDEFIVPKLVGMSLKRAKERLMKSGLKLGRIVYQLQPELLPETIVAQSPAPGTEVDMGDSVNVVVSKVENEKSKADHGNYP